MGSLPRYPPPVLWFPETLPIAWFSPVNSHKLSGCSSSIKSGSHDVVVKFLNVSINTKNPNYQFLLKLLLEIVNK